MRAAERTMRCRGMKYIAGNKIYGRDSCKDLIQNWSEILNDQEYKSSKLMRPDQWKKA